MGLQIVDISDPLSPYLLGSLQTSGSMKDVVVRGGLAYAADGPSGLAVIDVQDPGEPRQVGMIDTPGSVESVVLKGDLAFLADGPEGIFVVDVSVPEAPEALGSLSTGDMAEEVVVSGDFAFVANASSGLQVVDVSDPSSPVLHASLPTSGYAKGLTLHNQAVLLGNLYDASLQVIDVSDPSSPVELADFKYRFPNEPWDVVVQGDRAYILDYFQGIVVTDISDLSRPRARGGYITPQFLAGLDVDGDRAYTLGQENYGLAVVDLSDPGNPELVGRSNAGGGLRFPKFIEAEGEYGFVAYGALSVIDLQEVGLRNFTTPGFSSRTRLEGAPSSVRIRGNYAYATSDHGGFSVVDLSDMEAPTVVGALEMTGFSYGVALEGDHAFVGNRNTLRVIDVTDPTEPLLVTTLETPENVNDVKVRDGYAYLANGTSGFLVVDVRDPGAPALIGSLEVDGFFNSVALKGTSAYVTDEDFGVREIDISDAANPVLVGSFDTPGEPTDVVVYGDYVVVNDAFSIIVLK
jgi:hypothetical protein